MCCFGGVRIVSSARSQHRAIPLRLRGFITQRAGSGDLGVGRVRGRISRNYSDFHSINHRVTFDSTIHVFPIDSAYLPNHATQQSCARLCESFLTPVNVLLISRAYKGGSIKGVRQMNESTLQRHRLNAHRKWFDTPPVKPAASLATIQITRGTRAHKRLDTFARV